ncbi:hypothetical protein EB810_06010 [Altererythrobacter sp. FM1]|nr:hypothetical protein EB810_06010 [Altererythrobacter sp. FM1]
MNFASRLKKEMSEGIVRAVLEHADYRVTDFGIEKAVPYFNCLAGNDNPAPLLPTALATRNKPQHAWYDVSKISGTEALWWRLLPLYDVFLQLREEDCRGNLRAAIRAISGILDEPAASLEEEAA